MRGGISLGIGTIVGISLAIMFIVVAMFLYYNNMLPIPGLIFNFTQNASVVVS